MPAYQSTGLAHNIHRAIGGCLSSVPHRDYPANLVRGSPFGPISSLYPDTCYRQRTGHCLRAQYFLSERLVAQNVQIPALALPGCSTKNPIYEQT